MKEVKAEFKKPKKTQTDEEIIAEARKRFELVHGMNFSNRESFKKNMKFSFNLEEGHWNAEDLRDRTKKGRPALTAHKLGKFVAQVVNQERGTPDRDLVIPVDSEGDIKTANIYNQLIEDIEYKSEYDEIIQIEGEYAVGGGFGYWRVISEFTPDGFDQELRIRKIVNPLNVDIDIKERFAFIRESATLEELEEKYPSKIDELRSFDDEDGDDLWYDTDKIFVAEYYRKVPYQRTIAEVDKGDGTTGILDITDEKTDKKILRTRTLTTDKVEWYKMTGNVILERSEWVGSEIPIIEVDGHKLYLEGKVYKKALTTDAQSMNQAYDYWFTALTEKVALTPKAPFIVTKQQIQGHEEQWKTANVDNHPYLMINQSSAGIPQRTPSPEVGQGELLMLNICDANIKDVLGMYESSVGNQSNERSGKAIDSRKAQSNLGTYHFPDNLRKAKLKTKKILIEAIPKIYDNARVVRLIGRKEAATLNGEIFDFSRNESVKINDLSVGKYDIRASNPMNPSIRQQAVQNLTEAMQYAPTHADILLPLMLSYSDVPGMQEAVKALQQRTKQIEAERAAKIQSMQQPQQTGVNP
jgi:hypothetical protein